MLSHQAPPNSHTFPSLIKASSSSFSLALFLGRPLHAQVISRGLSLDSFILTSFVRFYTQFGDLVEARKVFEEIPRPCIASMNSMLNAFGKNGDMGSAISLFEQMSEKNVVSWTSIINGFGRNGCFKEAIWFFVQMVRHDNVANHVPNEATLVSVLSSCANFDCGRALYQGKQIHCYIIINNVDISVFLGTALISMYGKTGCLASAAQVFNAMKVKQVCTWNAMISSLASNGKEKEALVMFEKMQVGGFRPNEITLVAALTSCARAELVEFGLTLFQSMVRDFGVVPRMEHYGCVVDLLGRAGHLEEATKLIQKMPFEPDATVLGAILGACKVHGAVTLAGDVGRKLLDLQPQHCGRYVVLSNIYAEAGRWSHAAQLRKAMVQNGIRKVPAYSSLNSHES
ncbi:Pentatricopeptide repeat-containing protein [Thalictrum thalictroides]|uniref:Pentatricopeptide repeat-containing protein n=1 Tax=Thalictrum thalictroides TaxID=46969 RepID=A0A7J6VTS1_THATH|nr:Pentatricopeptide repeat-containing protein [Thalictrum thalictroides]